VDPKHRSVSDGWARILLCGLLVAVVGGKWGSYIGYSKQNIYLADVAVLIGICAALTLAASGRIQISLGPGSAVFVVLASAFVGYELLSRGQGPLTLRLRDLTPFLYLLPFPFYRAALHSLTLPRVLRWLDAALLLHAVWAIPALFGVLHPFSPGFIFGYPVFATRPDIDCPLVFAFAATVICRRSWPLTLKTLVVVTCALPMLRQTSRAALGAVIISLVVFLWAYRRRIFAKTGVVWALGAFGVLLGAVLLVGPALPSSLESGALGRSGLIGDISGAGVVANGQATASARFEAWHLMLNYWHQQGAPLMGLGPGTEIVEESGALEFLSDDPSVRAPHDWWVNCLVRYGPIGLALYLGLLALCLRRERKPTAQAPQDALLFSYALGAALAAGLLVAGSLGVVIESPFGSYTLALACAMVAISRPLASVWTPSVQTHSGVARVPTSAPVG